MAFQANPQTREKSERWRWLLLARGELKFWLFQWWRGEGTCSNSGWRKEQKIEEKKEKIEEDEEEDAIKEKGAENWGEKGERGVWGDKVENEE